MTWAQVARFHQLPQPAVTSPAAAIFHSEIDGVENNINLQEEDSCIIGLREPIIWQQFTCTNWEPF